MKQKELGTLKYIFINFKAFVFVVQNNILNFAVRK